MSQQESSSSIGSSARSASTTVEQQAQAQRHVPLFQPIDVDKARARAAIEQWRTFTMLLEPQVGAKRFSSEISETRRSPQTTLLVHIVVEEISSVSV